MKYDALFYLTLLYSNFFNSSKLLVFDLLLFLAFSSVVYAACYQGKYFIVKNLNSNGLFILNI
jgi:hypothetical protein